MRTLLRIAIILLPIPLIAAVFLFAFAPGVGAPRSAAAASDVQVDALADTAGSLPSDLRHTTPRVHGGPAGVADANSTSSNWSGYATTGVTYSVAKGSWKQPSVTCAPGETAYASFWVGLDGDTTATVEQIGTDSDCSSGAPRYYAWYEMFPKAPVNLNKPVSAGDTLTAQVSFQGGGSFLLTISDATKGWTFSTTQTSNRARRGSAEWIAEAPSGSGGVLPLANFGTVSFSACSADGQAIGANPNPDQIAMVSSAGTLKAQPSTLGAGGSSFSVAWKHS